MITSDQQGITSASRWSYQTSVRLYQTCIRLYQTSVRLNQVARCFIKEETKSEQQEQKNILKFTHAIILLRFYREIFTGICLQNTFISALVAALLMTLTHSARSYLHPILFFFLLPQAFPSWNIFSLKYYCCYYRVNTLAVPF